MNGRALPRPVHLTINDVRSVRGGALDVALGALTVLVGPNRAGASNIAHAVTLALDPSRAFVPAHDLPRAADGGPLAGEPEPWVRLTRADGTTTTVSFDARDGTRTIEGAAGDAPVIVARIQDTPRDLLAALERPLDQALRDDLARHVIEGSHTILPEVVAVEVAEDGRVVVRDELGVALPVPLTRALVAIALARTLADRAEAPAALVIESPEAFLHPAAQETMAAALLALALDTDVAVVITTTSPFAIPRRADVRVVGLVRDADGRTRLVGSASGEAPQARLLGGLLRDEGLADVFDRAGLVDEDTRAVLIVEGGTDVAYLRLAAERLGRERVLERVVLRSGAGAMGAATAAIVLRAESDVRLLVLLDHDDAGRRARDTLVSRFDFDRRREVMTYADVFEGGPQGVEAEALFSPRLLESYVAVRGRSAVSAVRRLPFGSFLDLTSSGKSGFVTWAEEHARADDLALWGRLFDLIAARLAS